MAIETNVAPDKTKVDSTLRDKKVNSILRDKKVNSTLSGQYVPCVKAAVEKRETAIITTVDTYTAAIKKSFKTRKAALLAAWTIIEQNERNIAIKVAFAQHRIAKRSALKLYKTQRSSAWNQFIKTRIACKAPATDEDMSADINFND
jgi:hypothetical protein